MTTTMARGWFKSMTPVVVRAGGESQGVCMGIAWGPRADADWRNFSRTRRSAVDRRRLKCYQALSAFLKAG